ncbi:autotransporter translocation and assembly factor TamB [Methylobacterium sp. OAE515]
MDPLFATNLPALRMDANMACASCQQARQAVVHTIKAAARGRVSEAVTQAGIAAQAVGDKAAEALRVRGLLRR